jgi:hypothetical protein
MSMSAGLVSAETFAAVDPGNNRKLTKDLEKLACRPERHRYVFFMSPKFPGVRRLPQFERRCGLSISESGMAPEAVIRGLWQRRARQTLRYATPIAIGGISRVDNALHSGGQARSRQV